MNAEFDLSRDDYRESLERSISFAGKKHEFYLRAKVQHLLRVLRSGLGDVESLRLLDVGCGIGLVDAMLRDRVAFLAGVDESADCVATARRENPGVLYHTGDGKHLPFEEGQFDAVFAMNVLHHVDPLERDAFLLEMARVCRTGGRVIVFDHNPYNPLTRLVVRRCSFDQNAVLLSRGELLRRFRTAGLTPVDRRFILIFPSDQKAVSWAEIALGQLPLGAQYYVVGSK